MIGYVYHKIDEIEGKKFDHIGFMDDKGQFGQNLEQLVPERGMKKRVKITIEVLE